MDIDSMRERYLKIKGYVCIEEKEREKERERGHQ